MSKKKAKKRILALVLALALIAGLLPQGQSVNAAGTSAPVAGVAALTEASSNGWTVRVTREEKEVPEETTPEETTAAPEETTEEALEETTTLSEETTNTTEETATKSSETSSDNSNSTGDENQNSESTDSQEDEVDPANTASVEGGYLTANIGAVGTKAVALMSSGTDPDPAPTPTYTYTYTITVKDAEGNTVTPTNDNPVVVTYTDPETNNDASITFEDSNSTMCLENLNVKLLTLKVSYGGLTFTANIDEATDEAVVSLAETGILLTPDPDQEILTIGKTESCKITASLENNNIELDPNKVDWNWSREGTNLSIRATDNEATITANNSLADDGNTITVKLVCGATEYASKSFSIPVVNSMECTDGSIYVSNNTKYINQNTNSFNVSVNGFGLSKDNLKCEGAEVAEFVNDSTDATAYTYTVTPNADLTDGSTVTVEIGSLEALSFTVDRNAPTGTVDVDTSLMGGYTATFTPEPDVSGIEKVEIAITDGAKENAAYETVDRKDEAYVVTKQWDWSPSGSFKYSNKDNYKTYVRVTDNAGNVGYVESVPESALDISVSNSSRSNEGLTVDGTTYYKDSICFNVAKGNKNKLNGIYKAYIDENANVLEDGKVDKGEFTVSTEGGFTSVEADVKDGNKSYKGTLDGNWYIDKTKPVVTISAPSDYLYTADGKYYYDAEQQITITIEEDYLRLDDQTERPTSISYYADSEPMSVLLKTTDWNAEVGKYVVNIDVVEGAEISNIQVSAYDYAGNETVKTDRNTYIIDETAPEIEFTSPEMGTETDPDGNVTYKPPLVNVVGASYYYTEKQEIRVTVTDAYLDAANTVLTYDLLSSDGTLTKDVTVKFNDAEKTTVDGSEYTCVIPVPENTAVSNIQVVACDYVKNGETNAENVKTKNITRSLTDAAGNLATFVVDTIDPLLTIETDAAFVTKSNGVIYFENTDKTNVNDDTTTSTGKGFAVEMTLTLTERNMDAKAFFDALSDAYSSNPRVEIGEWKQDEQNKDVYTCVIALTMEANQSETFEITLPAIADYVNHLLVDDKVTFESQAADGKTEKYTSNDFKVDDGAMSFKVGLDAKAPSGTTADSLAINIEDVTQPAGSYANVSGDPVSFYKDINSGLEFKAWITDEDSGIKSVTATYNGDTVPIALNVGDGYYHVTVGEYVADTDYVDCKLAITATDYAGNSRTKSYTYTVDNTSPQITQKIEIYNAKSGEWKVTADLNDAQAETIYLATDVRYTFTVQDTLPTLDGTTLEYVIENQSDGTTDQFSGAFTTAAKDWTSLEEGKYQFTTSFTINDGQKLLSYSFLSNDAATHSNSNVSDKADVVVDKTAPTVYVTKSANAVRIANGTDYYDQEVTYTITVYDLNLADLSNMVSISSEAGNVALSEWDYDESVLNHKAVATFTLDNTSTDPAVLGDKLNGLTITYADLAKNPVEYDKVNGLDTFTGNPGSYAYSGNSVIVDKVDPKIVITPPTGEVNYNANTKTYYFTAEQSITIEVADVNLDAANTVLSYHLKNATVDEDKTVVFDRVTPDEAVYTFVIPVAEGDAVSAVSVKALDFANRDQYDSTIVENTYIVDHTAPTAKISITGDNVQSVFTNSQNGGGIYVKFKNTATGASGTMSGGSAQSVTLTVEVSDANLATGGNYRNAYYVTNNLQNNISWTGNAALNHKSTLTYTQTISVEPDANGYVKFDLTMQDLAGNKLKDITAVNVNSSSFRDLLSLNAQTGKLTGTIIADRSRPSGTNDFTPPVITLTENQTPVNTVNNTAGESVHLYNASTSYTLKVTDPTFTVENQSKYSGLESVVWTVSDPISLTSTSGNQNTLGGDQSVTYNVPVTANGANETNDVVIRITATDKAGNVTTYEHKLAMDTLAPRVKVSYNNNSVQNERYFKEDRLLTVTIEDLNFAADRTTLTTERGVSGWSQSGNVYTATVNYNVDGDYTFNMSTIDKAANTATIDYTNGGANAAPQSFTIDKTVPVISVSYDNNSSMNGKYYKSNRTASVTINEHNFNSASVVYSGTAKLDGNGITVPSLNGWSNSGDNRGASISFNRDGDYSFTINYTDLAGNVATAYVQNEFTVDTTAPVINISGVENNKAYRGSVRPAIDLSDVNFDAAGYQISLKRRDVTGSEVVEYEASEATNAHGLLVTLANLASEQENDGIYTLDVTLTDKAGNMVTDSRTYSLNRFGSTYYTEDVDTQNLLDHGYANNAPVLKVIEINPDKLTEYGVSLSVNGSTRALVEGVDFTVEKSEGSGSWKQYVYTIYESAFLNNGELLEGEYTVTLTSTDSAGNANSNRTNTNELPMLFTIDTTEPVVSVTGIMNGDSIRESSREITVYFSDSSDVLQVEIYLNGERVKVLKDEELAACDGSYTITVEESGEDQEVYAIVTDAAGNQTVTEALHFYLNSSAFQQFFHNTPLVIGVVVVLLLLLGIFFLLLFKRKKDDEENQAKKHTRA